jgi:hypothetical protein
MTAIGADRGGRRIQCSNHRESGVCGNGQTVSSGEDRGACLRSQFADTSIIEAYVSAYQEEQKRLCSSALRDRGNATRLLTEAKDEITNIIRMMANGLIDEDEGTALLATPQGA